MNALTLRAIVLWLALIISVFSAGVSAGITLAHTQRQVVVVPIVETHR